MEKLTEIQQRVFDFVGSRLESGQPAPTLREIAAKFRWKSVRAAECHIEALIRKGWLNSTPGTARSLRVTSPLAKMRSRIVDIPLVGVIAAGLPGDVEEEAEGCVTVDIKSVGFTPGRNTIAIRVSGASMIGRHILDGDIVIVERGADGREGQIVVAHIDGKRTLKTLVVKDGKAFLKAENPKFTNLKPSEELVIEGVVKGVIRRLPN